MTTTAHNTPKAICRTSHSVEIDGLEYNVKVGPAPGTEILHRKLSDGRMVIGYLLSDEDCQNPCEDCDGMGSIRSLSHRHINNISNDEAIYLLQSDKMVVALSYFEHGRCKWGIAGSLNNTPDFSWDGVSFAGVWIPDDICREEIKSRSHRKHITYQAAATELAAACCSEYTAWANGDCWGVVVVTCNPDGEMIDSDECWGFIGSEYAEQELKERVESIPEALDT